MTACSAAGFICWMQRDEHAEERALRYAQAALLPLAGVEAVSVRREGERFIFGLRTMLGTGEIAVKGAKSVKFEEIYAHMAAEYKTLAGVEPEDAADVSIRLKVLAGELYTVLCAAESLKLNCFPQTAAGEALDLHAEERGLVRKDAVKCCGHADVFAPNGAELRGGDPCGHGVCGKRRKRGGI